MNIDEMLEGFRKWGLLQYSRATIDTYVKHVRKFLRTYGLTEDIDKIVEFIDSYRSPNTKMVAAHALRAFFEYLGRPEIATKIPRPRGSPNPPEVLTYDFDRLRRAIMMLPTARERAILCVAFEAALRVKEVSLLRREDFDPETCRLRVHRVKRPQGRPEDEWKILPPYCCRELQVYLAERRDKHSSLFLNAAGKPLQPHNVYTVYRKLLAILGIPYARFHQLRHTAITEKAQSLDLTAVAKYAGHRNPASSLVYIHLALENLLKRLKPAEREKLMRKLMEQLGYG